MKPILLFLSLALATVGVSGQISKVIPARPLPARLVNDFAHVLTPAQKESLENRLTAYDDSTSNQIAIVIFPALADVSSGTAYGIEEVALEILRKWGVGTQKHNNGVVILIALKERKARIETGYGLEGAIPDITAKTIIDHDITPNFRKGVYYRGLDAAINSVIQAAAGEYKAPEGYTNRKRGGSRLTIGKIIIGVILLIIIMSRLGGGRGGGFMSSRGYRGFGGPVFFPNTFGSSSESPDSGSGFGGFGGGSGGGGGASGSW